MKDQQALEAVNKVDYEFKKDIYGQPIAKFSMGHEAIGRWLSEELGGNQQRTQELLNVVNQIEQGKVGFRELSGSEFQLSLSQSGVEVDAITTDFDVDQAIAENNSLYEGESFSECGLQDFKQVLLSWYEFVS